MKPLLDPRVVKDTPRYWCVELEDHGQHHMRFPSYGRAFQVLNFSTSVDAAPMAISNLALAGLTVGLCWWHRAYDLETPLPSLGASHATLAEYSEAVIDELQEEEYSFEDIEDMYESAIGRINSWATDVIETRTAKQRKLAAERATHPPAEPEWTEEDLPDPGPTPAPGASSTVSP